MKTILLNESDRNLAAQALQLAASKYTEIANSFGDVPSLKTQFERQAADASRIGQLIWDANTVGLSVEEDMRHDEEVWSEGTPTMEVMHCDYCDASLEAGRIGLCDDCMEKCDCNDRSWYGEYHDSACPLAGKAR